AYWIGAIGKISRPAGRAVSNSMMMTFRFELLPLPLRERVGVRGKSLKVHARTHANEGRTFTPHPCPLPQGNVFHQRPKLRSRKHLVGRTLMSDTGGCTHPPVTLANSREYGPMSTSSRVGQECPTHRNARSYCEDEKRCSRGEEVT